MASRRPYSGKTNLLEEIEEWGCGLVSIGAEKGGNQRGVDQLEARVRWNGEFDVAIALIDQVRCHCAKLTPS